jgi:hypothetical protein
MDERPLAVRMSQPGVVDQVRKVATGRGEGRGGAGMGCRGSGSEEGWGGRASGTLDREGMAMLAGGSSQAL